MGLLWLRLCLEYNAWAGRLDGGRDETQARVYVRCMVAVRDGYLIRKFAWCGSLWRVVVVLGHSKFLVMRKIRTCGIQERRHHGFGEFASLTQL